MLSVFIFLIIIIFKAEARGPDNDPVEITFEILKNESNYITCDHIDDYHQQHKYTVLEGGKLTITTKYNNFINHLICTDYNSNNGFYVEKDGLKNVTTVQIGMGTVWNCTVLTHRNKPTLLPVVQYNNDIYSAASCFMKIHVRRRESPMTIFVNNMVLQAVRTDLSEKVVDFTAEYEYANGDVVDVTCVNELNPASLTMEYKMGGTMSDNSTMVALRSYRAIGFVATLHSGHNNSYMICTNTESTDYTKVLVRFVMRKVFSIVNVRINGMTLRPQLINVNNNYYQIEYKYLSDQLINVVCEVQQADMHLVVVDRFLFSRSYKKTVLKPEKQVEMSFYLNSKDARKLMCSLDDASGAIREQVSIYFTARNYFIDVYSLHMELSSNGTVMELYSDAKLKIIFYEFNDGETLQLKCGPFLHPSGPVTTVVYRQFKGSDVCKTIGCTVSKTLHVTRKNDNTQIVCYLKEQDGPPGPRQEDKVLNEIRVILRKKVLTTTTSTTTTISTTTTTTSPVTALTTVITTTNTAAAPASNDSYTLIYCLTAAGASVIIILAILYLTGKNPCCCLKSSSQELPPVPTQRPNPDTPFYENLLAVFQPINEREAAEMENHYEEIQ